MTASGVAGYQNTWDVTGLDGKSYVSEPITYFQPKDTTGTVEFSMSDPKYLDTYTAMVSAYMQSN